MRRGQLPRYLCGLVLALALAGGCNSAGEPTFRSGSLPFPGLYLFNVADPEHLGTHSYFSPLRWGNGEVGAGIIYTQAAGFVDIAHIRDAADWTHYYGTRIEEALTRRENELELGGPDGTRVFLRFNYPAGWDALPTYERQALVSDLALRCGQEASYAVWTWHEVITWYGDTTVPLVSEAPSSFTYEDVVSHVIGLTVAQRAWYSPGPTYNDAVTAALYEVIRELGPATREETIAAIEEVQGWWWTRGKALKRNLDVGLDDGEVTPMRIEGLKVAGAEGVVRPAAFRLPKASDVTGAGLDFSGFFALELESRSRANQQIEHYVRRESPRVPLRLVPHQDIPVVVNQVRTEMQRRISRTVDTVSDRPASHDESAQTAAGPD